MILAIFIIIAAVLLNVLYFQIVDLITTIKKTNALKDNICKKFTGMTRREYKNYEKLKKYFDFYIDKDEITADLWNLQEQINEIKSNPIFIDEIGSYLNHKPRKHKAPHKHK